MNRSPLFKSSRESTAWILSKRGKRAAVDPFKPGAWFLEEERAVSGRVDRSLCILLTGKECPWRCLMCDLWKHTLAGPTPIGAIPRQIDHVLAQLAARPPQVKLYNSGSFFDQAAVPPADWGAIADRVSFAQRVVVECHPRLIGAQVLRFRDLLPGSLEVAMGLETAQPELLERLNKRFTLPDFSRAAGFLRREGMGLRAFVLVNPPFAEQRQAAAGAVRSARYAFDCGASTVTLIPTRSGNGALDHLARTGEFTPPTLQMLEQALAPVYELIQACFGVSC